MYYDPYEECPERLPTGNTIKTVSVQDVKPCNQNLKIIDVGRKLTDSIPNSVKPLMEIATDVCDVSKRDLSDMQKSSLLYLQDSTRKHTNQSQSKDTLKTSPRHHIVNGSSMVMTPNSAYKPPADYGNLAQIKQQNENEDEEENEFHEVYMDLEPELSAHISESTIVGKRLTPIAGPHHLKSDIAQELSDTGVYEEPWDLIHRRSQLEKCLKAVALTDQCPPGLMNECADFCGQGEHNFFKADSSLTVKLETKGMSSKNRLQYTQNCRSEISPSESSQSREHFQQAIDGTSTPQFKPGADSRTNHGYDKPWDIQPHRKDGRGQEGYEKPWDLKPHLKDERPAVEYEIPWDKNIRGLEILDSRLDSDNRGLTTSAHALHRNEGSARIEIDFCPVADYDQPWDKINHFDSKTAVVLPFQVCDKDNWSTGQMAGKIDPKIPLELQGWYHGVISRVDAEGLLRVYPEGSFLVRTSESNRLDFSLSVKSTSGFMHMKIVNQDSRYILGQFSQPFYTIPQMIHHYTIYKLPIKGAEHMSLLLPVGNEFL